MSDWAPGDLALAIRGNGVGPYRYGPIPGHRIPVRGGIYLVEAVIVSPKGTLGLVLEGHHTRCPIAPAWAARSFVKIEPHAPDAEDIETIRLLNGQPVPVEA